MKKNGRPTSYSLKIADAVCERIALGESMRSISRDEVMPAMSTLFSWLRKHSEFSEQYRIAKKESASVYFEEMLDIADNEVGIPLLIDDKPVLDERGSVILVKDNVGVNHAKLRIHARQWAMSRLEPKKYGERIYQDNTIHNDFSALSIEDLNDELMRLLKGGMSSELKEVQSS